MKKKQSKKTIVPTKKQKKAFDLFVSDKVRTQGEALREAGYSKSMSVCPTRITKSAGWQKLLKEYLPDKELAKHHKLLLNASTIQFMSFPKRISQKEIKELIESSGCKIKKMKSSGSGVDVWYFAPDNNAKKSALEMAYKLKGRYEKDNQQKKTVLNLTIEREAAINKALEDI